MVSSVIESSWSLTSSLVFWGLKTTSAFFFIELEKILAHPLVNCWIHSLATVMDRSHIVRDRHTGTGLVGTLGLLRASRSSSFRRHPSKFSDLHVGDSQPADRLAIGHTNCVVCHSALCSPPCTADLTLSYPSCRPLCSSRSVSQPRGGVLQTASTLSSTL